MQLTLISAGRSAEPFVREACRLYAERIRRYALLRLIEVPEERVRGKREYVLRREGSRLREKLPPGSWVVALDEGGQALSSLDFARLLEGRLRGGQREVSFLVGGPYGLDPALKEAADFRLALSSMTLSHGLAKVLLLEQIYRAFTILRGEPYHK
ncbi:MAG: 23S rRNA (pseudouridine(1915)-N(3))-methyltransferase RlmH [Deltaproteobacteria bacterium]|nr:23S rRNA (pseudouridine(1915)-N(3))-methyltransferase RlmH [Deltaproteobacteria bacterium]